MSTPRPMCYCMEYRAHDYTFADAFRPNPKWGKRSYIVPVEKVGVATDAKLIEAAQQTAPDGYVLARLWEVGEGFERDIYVKKTPVRRADITTGSAS